MSRQMEEGRPWISKLHSECAGEPITGPVLPPHCPASYPPPGVRAHIEQLHTNVAWQLSAGVQADLVSGWASNEYHIAKQTSSRVTWFKRQI